MLKVYASEIEDGIGELVANNNVVAYMSLALSHVQPNDVQQIERSAAATIINKQPDLYYLKSVLVSTGWNNNDDIFLHSEMAYAAETPKDKQFNFMHDEKDIIGHITDSYLANDQHEVISVDDALGLDSFNIITSAVMYTAWSDPKLQERCQKLIAEIEAGQWFVSMETIFTDFDYMLKYSDGTTKIIARDDSTSFMSKYLRSYGGAGVYEGTKIGRVLKNLTFSGKGLVNNPANPKSDIIETQSEMLDNVNNEETLAGDKYMDELKLELEAVKANLAETQTKLQNAEATIASLTEVKAQAETLTASVNSLEAVKSELESAKAALEVSKAELEAQLSEAQALFAKTEEEKNKVLAELNTIKAQAKLEKRKASLIDAQVGEDSIEVCLTTFASLSDEDFDKVVAVFKKKNTKEEKEEKPEDKDAKAEDKTEASEILIHVEEKSTASLNELGQDSNSIFDALTNAISKELKTTRKK